jgi:hypothetical protein
MADPKRTAPGVSRYEAMDWEDLVGPQHSVSHAEVRDAALVSMGEGRRVPAPAGTVRYVDAPEELAELHRILGTP